MISSVTRLLKNNTFSTTRKIHTSSTCSSPRGIPKVSNRWGTFHRIGPISLASIDVRQLPHRFVPDPILRPPYAAEGTSSTWSSDIPFNTETDIAHMRNAGQLAKKVLDLGSTLSWYNYKHN